MDTLIINYKNTGIKRHFFTVIRLFFVIYCGYMVFFTAEVPEYRIIFLFSVIGFFISFVLFLSSSLQILNKALLTISDTEIESNIHGHKFKIDWVNVSNVGFSDTFVFFYTDGGKKSKKLDLAHIYLKDITLIKEKIVELCKHKNIVVAEGK